MKPETDLLSQAKANINVTPLIDVLLVLLIIFMVVTPMMTRTLDADVPQEATATPLASPSRQPLVLSVTADGRYLLGREPLGLRAAPSRLREVIAQRAGSRVVFVNADDSLPYGAVVRAMDLCRSAGAEHVALVLDPLAVER